LLMLVEMEFDSEVAKLGGVSRLFGG
jgi:hypothetical protein